MSYLVLARKYRPRRFEQVLGQAHVVKALSHALSVDKLHPAILLTGTRGVGKTTIGRIIAKSLNCEKGVGAEPCGECSACREVDEGRFVDLLEIDAASNTGVDNVRDLIEGAQYSPARGRYKVYLIDEVHMLSKQAFNALLKTLEEPPPHVKFILATTDPQKLPVTVLSRCLQFNLKRLPAATIREALAQVLSAERVEAEPAALAGLARAADGSMRDALSLLDQAIAFCGGAAIKGEAVEEMLGTVGRRALFEILDALAQADGARVATVVARLDEQAPDYAALLSDLARDLQRIAVLQTLPGTHGEEDPTELTALAGRLAPEDVQLYYEIAVAGRRDLSWAPDPRIGFEMSLIRMLAFRPAAPSSDAPVQRAAPPARKSAAPASAVAQNDMPWDQRVAAMGLDGFTYQLARHCAWLGRQGDTIRLALIPEYEHLLREDRRRAIEDALARQFGAAVRLRIEVAAAEAAAPVQMENERDAERRRAAEAAIESDPAVRALKERFGATVRPGSVQPIEK